MAIPRVLCRVRLLIYNDFPAVSKYSATASSVPLNKCAHLRSVRHFRTNYSAGLVFFKSHGDEAKRPKSGSDKKCPPSSSSTSSSDSDSSDQEDEVTIEYHRGLPHVTVPLPSRKETCRFTLRPISNTVGDFHDMLRKEDRGIDRVVCQTYDGTRIAASTSIETLMQDDFKLIINDSEYDVRVPEHERMTSEEIQRVSDVQHLVCKLYEALHVKEYQLQKELELTTQLETLQQELLPMEQAKVELDMVAAKRSNWMAWAGLGLMSVQFGILARLTWWEYSWDIMEPVTYFVTYGTAMACYAYYVLTRQEYILNEVRDRQHLLVLHKKAKKRGFDVNQYNLLKDQINRVEFDLRRLRDPIKMRLPVKTKAASAQQQPPEAKKDEQKPKDPPPKCAPTEKTKE